MYASDSSASDGIIMQRRARQLQCSTYIGLENIKNRIKFLKYVHKKWHKSLPWALVLGPPRPPSRTRRSHLSSVEPASQPQSAGPAPRGLKITVYNT